jgi:hypothetical protein
VTNGFNHGALIDLHVKTEKNPHSLYRILYGREDPSEGDIRSQYRTAFFFIVNVFNNYLLHQSASFYTENNLTIFRTAAFEANVIPDIFLEVFSVEDCGFIRFHLDQSWPLKYLSPETGSSCIIFEAPEDFFDHTHCYNQQDVVDAIFNSGSAL